jgi:hypothetical protein
LTGLGGEGPAGTPGSDETIWTRDETILGVERSQPETNCQERSSPLDNGEDLIMWILISSIYRAYCYARLLEMRSHHHHGSHA